MGKVEQFIQKNTKNYSNILQCFDGDCNPQIIYKPWLTPDQARSAVEIAREEIYEWLKDNIYMYNGECEGDRKAIIKDLKQAIKNE